MMTMTARQEKETPKAVSHALLYNARDSILTMKSAVDYDLDPRVDEVLALIDRYVREMGDELSRE